MFVLTASEQDDLAHVTAEELSELSVVFVLPRTDAISFIVLPTLSGRAGITLYFSKVRIIASGL